MSRSVSPKSNSQQQQQQQAESSADEITPIVNRERGGPKDRNYDSTSTIHFARSGVSGTSRHSSSSSARRRKGGQSRLGSTRHELAADESKDGGSWWKDLAEKYGSVELENKGSVARDHLALGVSEVSLVVASLFVAGLSRCSFLRCGTRLIPPLLVFHRLILPRTHLFGLASYIPRFRFDRYRCDSALPAQYYYLGAGRLCPCQSKRHLPPASGRKAIGSYLFGHFNLGFACRWEEIL